MLRYRVDDESEIRVQPLVSQTKATRQNLAVVGSFGRLQCAVPVAVYNYIVPVITPRVVMARYLILVD